MTWELILDGYSESSYSATPRFAAARLPWFRRITRMLIPTLKNGSRPRTCTAGSRKRWPIRLSGNMNTGSLWLP
ncbi:hypothetical protein AWP49_06475 [Escherichia coli]|nr:hypothetical protein AWP49_06475 [Escherichia coli]OKX73767.1 hypothetical protein AWP95_07310 [Escherichia coli]